jgi:NAD(P)-dependent dehydrogenase (short-subunit alcohol dehydrogenase family)
MADDAIAVVTGGESGIGAACAKALGDAGARVAITFSSDATAADSAAKTLHRQSQLAKPCSEPGCAPAFEIAHWDG